MSCHDVALYKITSKQLIHCAIFWRHLCPILRLTALVWVSETGCSCRTTPYPHFRIAPSQVSTWLCDSVSPQSELESFVIYITFDLSKLSIWFWLDSKYRAVVASRGGWETVLNIMVMSRESSKCSGSFKLSLFGAPSATLERFHTLWMKRIKILTIGEYETYLRNLSHSVL